jgi:DNA-binding PadR family transcriptional regulator
MKRDMDLIRDILLRLEKMHLEAGAVYLIDWSDPIFQFEGQTMDEVVYNLDLIVQSGFVNAPPKMQGGAALGYAGLTPRGHEFLDDVRDPKVWRMTKDGVQKVGGAGLDILVGIAKHYAKDMVSKTLGFQV